MMRDSKKLGAVRTSKPVRRLVGGNRRFLIEGLEWRTLFSNWITTSSESEVRQAYQEDKAATIDIPHGWTGNIQYSPGPGGVVTSIDGGNPGTLSNEFMAAALHHANYFRRMAGIPDIAFSAEDNTYAQAAALHDSADTANFAPGANANVLLTPDAQKGALGGNYGGYLGPFGIAGYMDDGPSLEHRNKMLNPNSTFWGFGDVPYNNGAEPGPGEQAPWTFQGANAMYFSSVGQQPWPAIRQTVQPFVAWPNPGFVPIQILGSLTGDADNNTWSFEYQFADFTDAQVTVTRNDTPVRVDYESDLGLSGKLTWNGK